MAPTSASHSHLTSHPTPTHNPPLHRRTRIVCLSDTHSNTFPALPQGDILLHAGNLTNSGSASELRKTLAWLSAARGFKLKILIAGDHDVSLDKGFYEEYGGYFYRGSRVVELNGEGRGRGCGELVVRLVEEGEGGLVYLNHSARTFVLEDAMEGGGTMRTRIKVFGSPFSPSRGLWAFGYAPEDAARLWAEIPLDADIVITHTPPKFHCDESAGRGAAGCEDLRRALWRVRPRLAVCGHVHEGRGVESVLWDLEAENVRHKEAETFYWEDATKGTKRLFLVDLTERSVRPLRNDGSTGETGEAIAVSPSRGREVSPEEHDLEYGKRVLCAMGKFQQDGAIPDEETIDSSRKPFPQSELAERPIPPIARPHPVHPSTWGIGGLPPTGRCDVEALAGREGRRETCIVNAAVVGSTWAHKAGKKLNTPIIVDLDLPAVLS